MLDGFVANGKEYRGRLPGLDADLVLRAAFAPRSIHVAGRDMAADGGKGVRRPFRITALGAVYSFERGDGRRLGDVDTRSLGLAALGARTEEGFARVVVGRWASGEGQ